MTAVIVTGSRDWTDTDAIRIALQELPQGSIVIHGAQRGADTIAGRIAKTMGHTVEPCHAAWTRLGRRAGPLRNRAMVQRLEALREAGGDCYVLAFPLPESKGTRNCIEQARRAGFEVRIYEVAPQTPRHVEE